MMNVKNIAYENNVSEVFKLIVPEGEHKGEYTIEEPDGWADVNTILDIDEEFFNVNNFIIGETHKLKFLQYNNRTAFEVIKSVYNEFGGDGKIIFKWIVNGEDILGDGFEINLNKYDEGYEMSMLCIETEIKKRETESLLLNREDISINIFASKSLDDIAISPVNTIEVGFKEKGREKKNFYFLSTEQGIISQMLQQPQKEYMFVFSRGDEWELGENTNKKSGYMFGFKVERSNPLSFEVPKISFPLQNLGPVLSTNVSLSNVIIEISNFEFQAIPAERDNKNIDFQLYVRITNDIDKSGSIISLKLGELITDDNGNKVPTIKITNEKFKIGELKKGDVVELIFKTNVKSYFFIKNNSASFEIKTEYPTPMRRVNMVRLIDALTQISKNYTNGKIEVQSNILGKNGYFYNTGISTGLYLRGLSYLFAGKITTSLKKLLYDGVSPLLGLGFDIQDNKLIIEDLDWFFKDRICYDLSNKDFEEESYKISNDIEMCYNQLLFGCKKYSTNKKQDLLNFNTKLEASTPILSRKKKLDKQTECIIDESKIQELILDNSSSTNNNDDDIILIDIIFKDRYEDISIFNDLEHRNIDNTLYLISNEHPFDTLYLRVGDKLTITEGINIGEWEILSIDRNRIKLNKQNNIEVGKKDTLIKFTSYNLYKNRTIEGFDFVSNVKDKDTITNLRHNPKFQLARWFGLYGGAFGKKKSDDKIKITNYKNNGNVELVSGVELSRYDISGRHLLSEDITLERLRAYKKTYFSGESIEIILRDVSFIEFFNLYNSWRSGVNARGYIRVNTPNGYKDMYLYGDKAIEHNMRTNELALRGKIKAI